MTISNETTKNKIQHEDELYQILTQLSKEDRLAFAKENKDKIQDGAQLHRLLPRFHLKDRLAFATENQTKIQNGAELSTVLTAFSYEDRLAFATENQTKIENGEQLAGVLHELIEKDRLKFAKENVDKIQGGDQLCLILSHLFVKDRLAFSRENKAKIQNIADLFDVLRVIPYADRLAFSKEHQNKLRGIDDFDKAVEGIDYDNATPLSLDEKRQLAEACCPAVRISYRLRENKHSRSLFMDPLVQQLIALQKIDANIFLFAAAANPISDDDFEFFLNHPLCSASALNARGQDLAQFIEAQSSLSSELRARRVAKVKALQDSNRRDLSKQSIGFNLSSIKQTELKVSGDLSDPLAADWSVEGVDPALITRFQQLIQWLNSQAVLAPFSDDFSALEKNDAIRTSAAFKQGVEALESFVANVALYLQQNPAAAADDLRLKSHLDARDQLGACAEGVLSALQSMTRSLNPSASVANAVDIALDQAINVFISAMGISEAMEVHCSKDRLLALLSLDSVAHYDPYRLAISPVYLQAIARDAASRLTPDFLISQSAPSLESLQKGLSLNFDAALVNVLERDWDALYSSGLLSEERTSSIDKCIDVICFINSEMTEEEAEDFIERYLAGNETQVLSRDLSAEKLTTRYQLVLEARGILTQSPEQIRSIKEGIWFLLTDPDVDFTLFNRILNRLIHMAPNGLSLIKEVIESHSAEEQAQIRLKTLLHCPEGSSLNILRSLATDPYLAGWMMGWELKRSGSVLSFDPVPTPLASALTQLMADENLMHKELEEIFIRPGNLLFWLGELQKNQPHRGTFECIMGFISAEPLYEFDNLLAVLDKMMSVGNPEEQTIARSFLEWRCSQQKEQGLWHCYWKTASYIDGFELSFTSKEMLLSLTDSSNAQAAVFVAGSNQKLAVKITQAAAGGLLSQDEMVVIIRTISDLYPPQLVNASTQPSPRANIPVLFAGEKTTRTGPTRRKVVRVLPVADADDFDSDDEDAVSSFSLS